MATSVMFRDLPGGPRLIKFADEISRHSLCGKCSMLSMSMYKDPKDHAFCEACLNEQSEKDGKGLIYCEYEQENIDIDKMFEYYDLLTALRDQYVECPNKKTCGMDIHLHGLKDHYTTCQPEVKCYTCHADVRSSEWEAHKYTCVRRGSTSALPTKDVPTGQVAQGAASSMNIEKFQNGLSSTTSVHPPEHLKDTSKGSTRGPQSQHTDAAGRDMILPDQASRPQPSDAENIEKCPYCERPVKLVNLKVHLTRCTKSPATCSHCRNDVEKANKKIHEDSCEKNPQNQAKVGQISAEERKQNSSKKGQQSSPTYSEVAKRGKGSWAKSSSSSMNSQKSKDNSKGTQQRAENDCARQTLKKETKSKPSTSTDEQSSRAKDSSSFVGEDTERHQREENDGAWLEYMRAGDWLSAFVLLDEWFRAKKTSDEEKYARLSTGLVDLELDTFVPEFLADPCKTRPFDCLMIAVLARFCLSRRLRPRRTDLSWDDVLGYVPSVLTKRLTKPARSYLKKHPVFFNADDYAEVNEVGVKPVNVEIPVIHSSNNSCDLQATGGGAEGSCASRTQLRDALYVPKRTEKNTEQQQPEADSQHFQRATIHHIMAAERNIDPSTSSPPEKRDTDDVCNDMEAMEVTESPETCIIADPSHCQETPKEKNMLTMEARPSSPSHLTWKKGDLVPENALSELSALHSLAFEKLGLNTSTYSEKPGDDTEMLNLLDKPTALKAACYTSSEHTVATKSRPKHNVGVLCSSHLECKDWFAAQCCHGNAAKINAIKTDSRARGTYMTEPTDKYEKIESKNVEDDNASTASPVADHLGQHLCGQAASLKHDCVKMANAEHVSEISTCVSAPKTDEFKTHSFPNLDITDSRTLVDVPEGARCNESRLEYMRKMLEHTAADEKSSLPASAEPHDGGNSSRGEAPVSKRGCPETSGSTCKASKRGRKVDTGSVAQRICNQPREHNVDGAPFANLGGHGGEKIQLSRLQADLTASHTTERYGYRSCQRWEYYKDEAGCPPSGADGSTMIPDKARASSSKGHSLRIKGEVAQDEENTPEVLLKYVPATEQQSPKDKRSKLLSYLSAPQYSSDGCDLLPETTKSRDMRICSSQDFTDMGKRGEEHAQMKTTSSEGVMAQCKPDQHSRRGGYFESSTRGTRSHQVDAVKMPAPEVQMMQRMTRSASIAKRNVPSTDCTWESNANKGSQVTDSELYTPREQHGHFQKDYTCSKAL